MNWFKREKTGAPPEKPKKESRFPFIRLLGGDRAVLFEGPLNELRFAENLIIARSVFFFNDPDPCFIHRGAVATRLFGEINLLLEKSDTISIAELNKECPGYLDEYPGTETIEVFKKE